MPFLPLLTLTLATFAIGTTEFAIQGLLPEISADFGVSIPSAGLLVTAYALGVAIGGPILAILTNRLPRKTALLALMGIFVVGHLLCAVAPDYALLMVARVVASFCHGAFFGIGSVVAVSLVAQDRRASAVALMWAGAAASNILGVPAGTALGQAFGWRSTFWAVALLGAIATAAIAAWLPDTGRGGRTRLASEFKVLAKPQVLLALALSVLICAATFSVFTYIAPLLIETTGISPAALPLYLLLFGVGGVIGMQVGGRFADRNLMASIIGVFAANVVVYLILLVAFEGPTSAMVMMFVWGFAFYFIAAPIQIRVVNAAFEAPNLASTLVQSGFNLGNAIGPFAGAAALSAGFNYGLLPWLGALLASAGVAMALWSVALERRAAVRERATTMSVPASSFDAP
jgi:DHA1 family inner membrane transport protein